VLWQGLEEGWAVVSDSSEVANEEKQVLLRSSYCNYYSVVVRTIMVGMFYLVVLSSCMAGRCAPLARLVEKGMMMKTQHQQ
jgi:hypothetical protein